MMTFGVATYDVASLSRFIAGLSDRG